MESVLELIGQLAWPIVVCGCVIHFRKPLRDALNELAGFIGRSRYGAGDGRDDLPVSDAWVPIEDALVCRSADRVADVVSQMTANDYSAVPMVDNKGCLIGVVSLSRIAQAIRKDGSWPIGPETSCGELCQNGRVENADSFKVVSAKAKISQLRRYYQRLLRSHQDFHFIFITENGKRDEPLLGFVTVWDVAVKG